MRSLITICIFTYLLAASESPDRWLLNSPHWGSLKFDGTLHLVFPLSNLMSYPETKYSIHLLHKIVKDQEGNGHSVFVVPELETWVAPEGRDVILWRRPGGLNYRFKRNLNGNSETKDYKSFGTWNFVETGEPIILKDLNNRNYFYERGNIKKIISELGNTIGFESNSGRIHCIYDYVNGVRRNILEVTYRNVDQPSIMQINNNIVTFEYENGFLVGVVSKNVYNDRKSLDVVFEYSNRLLVKMLFHIGGSNGNFHEFAWSVLGPNGNKSLNQFDDLGLGIKLLNDSNYKFKMGKVIGGIEMERWRTNGDRESLFVPTNGIRALHTDIRGRKMYLEPETKFK